MSGIFGGKKNTSSSIETNVNRGLVNDAYGGSMAATGDSINSLQALLGGDSSGFRAFTDAIDLSGQMEMGSRGVTGNAAARGLLRSGSTGKALVNYEQQMENQAADTYMQRLLGIGQLGLGAGELVAGAGREGSSQSKGREKPGLGGFLGQVGAGIAASDERLKTDITPVGKNRDGLTVYQYRYKGEPEVFTGVMAQEVAERKPEALGPTINGYMTVDYDKVDILDRSE
jgi:hypothetical protein